MDCASYRKWTRAPVTESYCSQAILPIHGHTSPHLVLQCVFSLDITVRKLKTDYKIKASSYTNTYPYSNKETTCCHTLIPLKTDARLAQGVTQEISSPFAMVF